MDLFGGDAMAAGYASSRPAVHSEILGTVQASLDLHLPVRRVLDVGCGAGASTRAAGSWGRSVIGVDPEPPMARAARAARAAQAVPDAQFAVGSAEAMPVSSRSVDVITAAGVLNFVDLASFGTEAERVLVPGGIAVVYDFATGARSAGAPDLERGYQEFARRWPRPAGARRPVDVNGLTAAGFAVLCRDSLVVTVEMQADGYVDYLMTETNVAGATQRGETRAAIEEWCRDRFGSVFDRPVVVEFDAWYAVVTPPCPP